jgi:acetylornithine deacetylase/succinyl-diaminopimelate desuccinylase-like protein
VTLVREPFEVAESEPIVKLVREQAHKATGREPMFVGWAGWMDSALLSAAGIPTVVYGPGGEGSHATVEWANLDHLEILRNVLIATAREFCV